MWMRGKLALLLFSVYSVVSSSFVSRSFRMRPCVSLVVFAALICNHANAANPPAKPAVSAQPAAQTSAGTRGFSVDDLVRLDRVSNPALSPDGQRIVFTMRETDIAANRGRTDLWVFDLAKPKPRRVTSHPEDDSQP